MHPGAIHQESITCKVSYLYVLVVKKAAEGEGGVGTEQREADQTRTGNKFECANMIIKV